MFCRQRSRRSGSCRPPSPRRFATCRPPSSTIGESSPPYPTICEFSPPLLPVVTSDAIALDDSQPFPDESRAVAAAVPPDVNVRSSRVEASRTLSSPIRAVRFDVVGASPVVCRHRPILSKSSALRRSFRRSVTKIKPYSSPGEVSHAPPTPAYQSSTIAMRVRALRLRRSLMTIAGGSV